MCRNVAFKEKYSAVYDKEIWEMVFTRVEQEGGIVLKKRPEFVPYVKLNKPTAENVKEYNDNNVKMATRLGKEDKTKRIIHGRKEEQVQKKRVIDSKDL